MTSHTILYRSSRVHYLQGGRGNRLLLCFHGYGESAATFGFLEEELGSQFTLIALDMPFHGQTDWQEGLHFTPGELLTILDQIATGLPGLEQGWWLMGYSMGGRVALSLLEKAPEKFSKLVLLAPDGLRVNPWYWLATQTSPGNLLFRWTMRKPGWFFLILRIGNALRLVNPSVYKFTVNYIGNAPFRQELYTRWTTMRDFRPDLKALKVLIRQRQVPVRLLYGRYDRIIREERGEQFRQGIEEYSMIYLLPQGHQLLQLKNLGQILSLIRE